MRITFDFDTATDGDAVPVLGAILAVLHDGVSVTSRVASDVTSAPRAERKPRQSKADAVEATLKAAVDAGLVPGISQHGPLDPAEVIAPDAATSDEMPVEPKPGSEAAELSMEAARDIAEQHNAIPGATPIIVPPPSDDEMREFLKKNLSTLQTPWVKEHVFDKHKKFKLHELEGAILADVYANAK